MIANNANTRSGRLQFSIDKVCAICLSVGKRDLGQWDLRKSPPNATGSLRRERVASQRQSKASPDLDHGVSKRVDQRVIMVWRRRDAQPLGPARHGRIVDRLDIDAVLGEQEIARFLALLRISHHDRHEVRLP